MKGKPRSSSRVVKKKGLATLTLVLLVAVLSVGFVPSVQAVKTQANDYYELTLSVSHPYFIRAETAEIYVQSNASVTVTLKVWDPDDILIWTENVTTDADGRHTQPLPIQANAPYGVYTIRGYVGNAVCETWFWVQKINELEETSVPYSWSWKGINYTLLEDYTLQAEGFDGNFNIDWLSEIFTKFKPTVSVYRNEYLTLIKTLGKDIDADHWLMSQHQGLKIRINGTLASETTLKWNFKNLAATEVVVWRLNSFNVGHLVYDWSDYDRTGVSYTMDKTNLKMNVYLSTAFDIDPVIFEAGFEDGDLSEWTGDAVSGSGTIDVQTSHTHHGSYAANVSLPVHASYAVVYKNIASAAHIFMRGHAMFTNVTLQSGGTVDVLMRIVNSTGGETYLMTLKYKNQSGTPCWALQYRTAGSTVTTYSSGISLSTLTWYPLEVEMKCSSADDVTDGEYRVYFEDSCVINVTGIDTDYLHADRMVVGGKSYFGPAPVEIYWDCIVVDDEYIGLEPEVANEAVTVTNLEDTSYVYGIRTTYNFVGNWSCESGVSNLDFGKIAFSDGATWYNVTIDLQSNAVTVESGSANMTVGSVTNATSGNYANYTIPITFNWNLADADNVDVYMWVNDTSAFSAGWEVKGSSLFTARKPYSYTQDGDTRYVVGSAEISSASITDEVLTVKFSSGSGSYKLYSNCSHPTYLLNVTYDLDTDYYTDDILNVSHTQNNVIVAFTDWSGFNIKSLSSGTLQSVSWSGRNVTMTVNGTTGQTGTMEVNCTGYDTPSNTGGDWVTTGYDSGTKIFTGTYTFTSELEAWLDFTQQESPGTGTGGGQPKIDVSFQPADFGTIYIGQSIEAILSVVWKGTNEITVTDLEASPPQGWLVKTSDPLPQTFTKELGEIDGVAEIRLTIMVPLDAHEGVYTVPVQVYGETVGQNIIAGGSFTITVEAMGGALPGPVPSAVTIIFLIMLVGAIGYGFLRRK